MENGLSSQGDLDGECLYGAKHPSKTLDLRNFQNQTIKYEYFLELLEGREHEEPVHNSVSTALSPNKQTNGW